MPQKSPGGGKQQTSAAKIFWGEGVYWGWTFWGGGIFGRRWDRFGAPPPCRGLGNGEGGNRLCPDRQIGPQPPRIPENLIFCGTGCFPKFGGCGWGLTPPGGGPLTSPILMPTNNTTHLYFSGVCGVPVCCCRPFVAEFATAFTRKFCGCFEGINPAADELLDEVTDGGRYCC